MNILKMHIKSTFIAMLIFISLVSHAQTDSTKPALQVSGYVECYYIYDAGNPSNHTRSNFIYAYNRHNEVNLNLGVIKASYQKNAIRANVALGVGTYMQANYLSEPNGLSHIYEANVGVKISKRSDVWVDAGVFSSHIGFESAMGKDCWTLTRSILADNSPYFETGVKISYNSKNEKWFLSGLVLNGWQRIQRVDGNQTPAFGHQITYKPNDRLMLNSSSFVGNDKPDSVKQMRYFHNLYAQYLVTKKLGLILGFDIGAEQKMSGSTAMNTWYSPILIARYTLSPSSFLAARLEYYVDKNGVIIGTGTPNGFQTLGYSVNYDRQVRDNVLWRIEARGFEGKDPIFRQEQTWSNHNYSFTTSLAIGF